MTVRERRRKEERPASEQGRGKVRGRERRKRVGVVDGVTRRRTRRREDWRTGYGPEDRFEACDLAV